MLAILKLVKPCNDAQAFVHVSCQIGAKTIELIHQNVSVEAIRDDLDEIVLDAEFLEVLLNTPDPRQKRLDALIEAKVATILLAKYFFITTTLISLLSTSHSSMGYSKSTTRFRYFQRVKQCFANSVSDATTKYHATSLFLFEAYFSQPFFDTVKSRQDF